VDETARNSGNEERVGNLELDGMVQRLLLLGQHVVQLGGLANGSRESVKNEAALSIARRHLGRKRLHDSPVGTLLVLLELLPDHANHDLVADKSSGVHDLLSGLAELGLSSDLRTEHVTRSEVADAVLARDVGGLGALTCWSAAVVHDDGPHARTSSGRTDEDQSRRLLGRSDADGLLGGRDGILGGGDGLSLELLNLALQLSVSEESTG